MTSRHQTDDPSQHDTERAYYSIAQHVESNRISLEDHSICAECGGRFEGETKAARIDERCEVVNEDTGQRGVVHVSCYEANDDILVLA